MDGVLVIDATSRQEYGFITPSDKVVMFFLGVCIRLAGAQ